MKKRIFGITTLLLFPANIKAYDTFIGSTFTLNWTDANKYCATNYGTSLATITSDSENSEAYAAGLAASNGDADRFFIGLNDINDDSIWTWIDGSTSSYRYTFGISGDGNCAEYIIDTNGNAWNDLSCSSFRYFVCNFNTLQPTQGTF